MNEKLQQVQEEALALCAPVFDEMKEISLYNTQKVLEAFRNHHLSAYHFAPSNGYGYGDPGREELEEISFISSKTGAQRASASSCTC